MMIKQKKNKVIEVPSMLLRATPKRENQEPLEHHLSSIDTDQDISWSDISKIIDAFDMELI